MSNNIFSDSLIDRLKKAKRVAVLTGAGISAESGIATFRASDGIWNKFKPEELARMDAFLDNPERVQEWYKMRREIILSKMPNPGHFALAALEKYYDKFTLITQNVDGLHQRAGSKNVIEVHGTLLKNYCVDCDYVLSEDEINTLSTEGAARCPKCSGLVRPDVVWFGEMLPQEAFSDAMMAAETSDVFFSIGTSAVVYPAAGLPTHAKGSGAFAIEINLEPSEIAPQMDAIVLGPAGKVLPALCEALGITVETEN